MLRRTNDGYYLSGDDARAFHNALNHPTKEKALLNAKYMQHIDDSIHFINSNENGFRVVVDDLDVSLINNEVKGYSFDVIFSITIKALEIPDSIDLQEHMHTEYLIKTEEIFSETDRSEYLSIAA